MSNPQDASIRGDGFRFYRWEEPGKEPVEVLSVTSIRTLCGEPYTLVNWKMANLADAALGTMKRTVIGPRGGVSEKRQVWEFPSEFVTLYLASEGEQAKVDAARKFLRDAGDQPRNIAAVRGTITHEAIEKDVAWRRIERAYVENAFAGLSQRDRAGVAKGVQDEDVSFVRNADRQYWAMRKDMPMVILAREVQVWNLTAGYGGTADAFVWVLGEFTPDGFVPMADARIEAARALPAESITAQTVEDYGGTLVLVDWKTATDIHTDNVVQATAYMSAEFVGSGGVVDRRLTDMLAAIHVGGIVHIRPNGWSFKVFEWSADIARAFFGSVAFARFLARYPEPGPLFIGDFKGSSEEEE